jgi:type II secretory pathway component PulM
MSSFFQTVQNSLHQKSAREQILIQIAVLLIAIYAVWQIAVSPALGIMERSATQLPLQQAQISRMQRMQQEAIQLQTKNSLSETDSVRALQTLAQTLGPQARLVPQGTQATLEIKSMRPDVLAQFLMDARAVAQATVTDAKLARNNNEWEGSLILRLPSRTTSN